MKVIQTMEFELAYYDVAVKHVSLHGDHPPSHVLDRNTSSRILVYKLIVLATWNNNCLQKNIILSYLKPYNWFNNLKPYNWFNYLKPYN